MFLLVLAYPGSPGPNVVTRLCVCVCVCACVRACVRACVCYWIQYSVIYEPIEFQIPASAVLF